MIPKNKGKIHFDFDKNLFILQVQNDKIKQMSNSL